MFKSSPFHDWECPQECVLLKLSGLTCKLNSLILTGQDVWVPSCLKNTHDRWNLRDEACGLVQFLPGLTSLLLLSPALSEDSDI